MPRTIFIFKAVLLFLLMHDVRGRYPQERDPPPQDLDDGFSSQNVVGPAPICEGWTFCVEAPNYPTEIVARHLEKNPSLLNFMEVDVANFASSLADNFESEPLCISYEQVVFPKSGQTINYEWHYIVNTANFTQGVRIETCAEEEGACKVIDGFAQGYVTKCKQKFIYRQLSAIAANGEITHEYFRFPASCCCHVEFTGEQGYK